MRTAITGFYGMNVVGIPALQSREGPFDHVALLVALGVELGRATISTTPA